MQFIWGQHHKEFVTFEILVSNREHFINILLWIKFGDIDIWFIHIKFYLNYLLIPWTTLFYKCGKSTLEAISCSSNNKTYKFISSSPYLTWLQMRCWICILHYDIYELCNIIGCLYLQVAYITWMWNVYTHRYPVLDVEFGWLAWLGHVVRRFGLHYEAREIWC